MSERKMIRIRHKDSKEPAIGLKVKGGLVLVQFNRLTHPQSHGWTLYPRHHFERRSDRQTKRHTKNIIACDRCFAVQIASSICKVCNTPIDRRS